MIKTSVFTLTYEPAFRLERQYKEFSMTTYLHHRLSVRPATVVTASAQPARFSFHGTKGLSAMLLAAMVSALVVVADQLIETWADGHLMVAWVALWLVAFTAIALFADAAHKLAGFASNSLRIWLQEQEYADQWHRAQADPRLLADLEAARTRAQG